MSINVGGVEVDVISAECLGGVIPFFFSYFLSPLRACSQANYLGKNWLIGRCLATCLRVTANHSHQIQSGKTYCAALRASLVLLAAQVIMQTAIALLWWKERPLKTRPDANTDVGSKTC